uniref:Uncharacterized protein n=1 Tax=Macrostomum lignano TaxID=282301 RepID=A0A1I8FLS6_9PLAT
MKSEQPGAESRGQTDGLDDASNINIGPDHKDASQRAVVHSRTQPAHRSAISTECSSTKAWATSPSSSLASTSGQLRRHVSEVFGGTQIRCAALIGGQVRCWTSCISVRHVHSTLPKGTLGDSNRRSVAITAPRVGVRMPTALRQCAGEAPAPGQRNQQRQQGDQRHRQPAERCQRAGSGATRCGSLRRFAHPLD